MKKSILYFFLFLCSCFVHDAFSQCTLTVTPTNLSCHGGSNGSASASASGGTPPYTYVWSTGVTNASVSNLSAGNYSVTVINNTCSISGVELVNNGNFSGGNSGFSSSYIYNPFSLSGEGMYNVATNPSLYNGGFCSCGDHTSGNGNMMIVNGAVTANTSVWCETITVSPNTDYDFSTWVTSMNNGTAALLQFSINGNPLGSIFTAPATGVWQQFFAVWNSGANTSANICIVNQNTTAGGNDFALDDISFQECVPTLFCTTTQTFTITEPAAISSTITPTQVACGGNNGSATVTSSGGTGAYTYLWSDGQVTQNATGFAAGSYSILITDNNGCTQTNSVTITQLAAFTSTVTAAAAIPCNGGTTSATASITGGSSPFTYLWNNNQTTQNATGLNAGSYTVTITDHNGCTQTDTLSITQPAALTSTATATSILCNGGTATATASASGGTSPYTYLWSNTSTTQQISNLIAGNYSVAVADAAGCPSTQTIAITQPAVITITATATQTGCTTSVGTALASPSGGTGGYTYLWNPTLQTNQTATGLATGTYSVIVADVNSCTQTQTVSVIAMNTLSVTASFTQAGCIASNGSATLNPTGGTVPYLYNWDNGQTAQTATGLAAGNYSATVTDANGCTQTQTVSVTALNTLSVTTSSTQTGCTVNNGTATANPSGGTVPYLYNWNNGQTTSAATGLAAGNYSATVTDANGCTQQLTTSVTQIPGPTATASASSVIITQGNNSQLTATGTGTYQWSPSTGLNCSTCANPIATPPSTTLYCVTVTDANGCSDSACVTINVEIPCGTVYIPNAFSPNNDNENDLECVIGNCIQSLHIAIYNRWGDKVFESSDQNICWDGTDHFGTYKGQALNTAVFVYYMEATLTSGEKIKRKGNISLVR